MSLSSISNSKEVIGKIYMKQMSEPDIRTIEESSTGIYLGKTLIYSLPFFLDVSVLTSPHIAVIGMTGSGKTFMLKNFIIRNSVYSEPNMLILDMNGEYRNVVQGAGGKIFRLGKDFKINLFEFLDYNQDKAVDSVIEIIEAYTKMAKDEAAVVHNAISCAISNAEKISLRAIAETVGRNWPQLKLKLRRLAGSAVFADATSFTISSLFKSLTSIDLSEIESDVEKNFISYILVRLISESLNKESINQKTNKFIILDEAWKSVENIYLSRLFREGRKYGFGIIVASQLIGDINNVILSNSSCVLVFKVQNMEDFRILEDTGIANKEHISRMPNLDMGECFVYLSFKKENSRLKRFFIKKIDGLPIYSHRIYIGDKMELEISDEKFELATRNMQIENKARLKIANFVEENGNNIEITAFMQFLTSIGISRAEIVSYLKRMGVSDAVIVEAYERISKIAIEIKEYDEK